MGLLSPIAVTLGSFRWMPRLLPQITWLDTRLQRLTGGRVSLVGLAGLPSLLLTVRGRRTGLARSTPLLCVPRQGGWLVAGSSFGAPKPPAWAANLRAAETVEVEYRRRRHTCRWRELTGAEKDRAWAHMQVVWPNYAKYTEWTDREIPVFLLTPM